MSTVAVLVQPLWLVLRGKENGAAVGDFEDFDRCDFHVRFVGDVDDDVLSC